MSGKVGLALGAGAARGLAHIGVLKALTQEAIPIDMIAGTSMGSLVGAVYAARGDIRTLEEIVLKTDLKRLAFLIDPTLPRTGFIDGKKVRELLRSLIGGMKFSELKIPFAVVATDIKRGEEVVISEGSVVEAVRASISIPVLFTPVKFGDRFLTDGGIVNPVPVSVARKMGSNFIIACNVIPDVRGVGEKKGKPKETESEGKEKTIIDKSTPKYVTSLNDKISKLIKNNVEKIKMIRRKAEAAKIPNIFNVIAQTIYIAEYQIVKSKLKGADVIISPRLSQIRPIDFLRAGECILEGEIITRQTIPDIKRLLKDI